MPDLRRVPTGLRTTNVLSLLLFLAGAGLYIRAWLGMQRLATAGGAPGAPGTESFSAMDTYAGHVSDSRTALALIGAALALAIGAAVGHARARRRLRLQDPRGHIPVEPAP